MTFLKQPLIQFLLLGTLVFVLDRLVVGVPEPQHRILVDDAIYTEIADIYRTDHGRDPSEIEMSGQLISWAQDEALYREALRMELDKGDETIRQYLVGKLRDILFNQLAAPSPVDAELEAWFEAHRADYDRPDTYDLEQFRVPGENAAEVATRLASELGSTEPPPEQQTAIWRYQKRPAGALESGFGNSDARDLISAEPGRWVAVSSAKGWHLARITRVHPGKKADFRKLRDQLADDWQTQATQTRLTKALQDIAARYQIRMAAETLPNESNESGARQRTPAGLSIDGTERSDAE